MDPNITTASLKAVLSALERLGIDLAGSGQLAGATSAGEGSKG